MLKKPVRSSIQVKYCPICASMMQKTCVQLKGGTSLSCSKCPKCHHMVSRKYHATPSDK